MFDRASEGWTVTVVLTEPGDIRPLQILGLPTVCADAEVGSTSNAMRLLAVSNDVLGNDARVRDAITTALNSGDPKSRSGVSVLPPRLQRTPRPCNIG